MKWFGELNLATTAAMPSTGLLGLLSQGGTSLSSVFRQVHLQHLTNEMTRNILLSTWSCLWCNTWGRGRRGRGQGCRQGGWQGRRCQAGCHLLQRSPPQMPPSPYLDVVSGWERYGGTQGAVVDPRRKTFLLLHFSNESCTSYSIEVDGCDIPNMQLMLVWHNNVFNEVFRRAPLGLLPWLSPFQISLFLNNLNNQPRLRNNRTQMKSNSQMLFYASWGLLQELPSHWDQIWNMKSLKCDVIKHQMTRSKIATLMPI